MVVDAAEPSSILHGTCILYRRVLDAVDPGVRFLMTRVLVLTLLTEATEYFSVINRTDTKRNNRTETKR